jgi:hypothetical protein
MRTLKRSSRSEGGFSVIEAVLSAALLATALVALAQLLVNATGVTVRLRSATYAMVLAEQKVEELRALEFTVDGHGVPHTDETTNTATVPETATGGTGLRPSSAESLVSNVTGYVDHVDAAGRKVGDGSPTPPPDAIYTRRWAIEPAPGDPANTIVIQVSVVGARTPPSSTGAPRRLEEARLLTVRTRTAR